MKTFKLVSGLTVYSFDSVVYELVEALILSAISSSVQGARLVTGFDVSFMSLNRLLAQDICLTPMFLQMDICPQI